MSPTILKLSTINSYFPDPATCEIIECIHEQDNNVKNQNRKTKLMYFKRAT